VGALFVPPAFAAIRLRRRVLPAWAGSDARIVEIVYATAAIVAVCQLLGAVGAFRVGAVYPVMILVSVGGLVLARSLPRPDGVIVVKASHRPWELALVIATAIVVLSLWSLPFFAALSSGPIDVDTQTYHLPNAARFVQEGWLTRLHHTTPDNALPYHPANSEVIHALLMMSFGSDFLSLFLNHLWAVLLIVAAWSFGSRWDAAAPSAVAMCLVLAIPALVSTQPGSAMNDTMGLFFFVASIAILVRGQGSLASTVTAALAAGIAVGTKLTLLGPVVALTLALPVFAILGGRRVWRPLIGWGAGLALTGSYWFVRNWVRVGNPVPAFDVHVGPISFDRVPMKLIDHFGYSIADYLTDGDVWTRAFLPGLGNAAGRIWPFVIVLPVVILMAGALMKRDLVLRVLALVALFGVIGYIGTPATAFGTRGQPVLFAQNVRYALPSVCLGLLIGVALLRRWTLPVAVVLSLATLATLHIPPWPPGAKTHVWKGAIVLGCAAAVAAAVWWAWRTERTRRVVMITGACVVLAGGFVVRDAYLRDRYSDAGAFPKRGSWGRETVAFAQRFRDARIGFAGFFLQYGYYGHDLSNTVDYIGELSADGRFTDIRSCAQWRQAVNDGRYDYVIVMPPFDREAIPLQAAWTRSDSGAAELFNKRKSSVFRIEEPLDPDRCDDA
jgi:hypothetical protein